MSAQPKTESHRLQSKIIGGIEWYTVDAGPVERDEYEDCQCARCGSSCEFRDCWNCDHGFVEEDIGDDACEEWIDVRCRECHGRSGSWHCISTPEYCEAHPLEGRESIVSTALKSEGVE